MPKRLRGFLSITSLVVRDQPWAVIGTTAFSIASQVADPLLALGLKVVTDAATEGDADVAIRSAVALGVFLGVWSLLAWASFSLRMKFRERTSVLLDSEVARMASTAHTLEHHERPDYLDEMQLLRQESQTLTAVPDSIVVNISFVMRFVATIALLCTVDPLLLLLPLAAVPSIALSAYVQRLNLRLQERLTPTMRLEGYLMKVARDAAAAKELRVFGLGPEILRRFDAAEDEYEQIFRKFTLWQSLVTVTGWLGFGAGFIAALVLVAHRATTGDASAGDVVLALSLAAQVNSEVRFLVDLAAWATRCAKAAGRYQWLADYAHEQSVLAHPNNAAGVRDTISEGIRFNGVSFRYPGTEVDVLADVNLALPSGATIAVVGDNGAGKTTLVKLLCRFYDPTAGSITVDDVDLRDIDVDDWRARMAGGFQDFAQFEFVASQSVGVGDLEQLDDADAVNAALARAQAHDLPATLPHGLGTQLGRSFDGGAELSIGQWQKVALGRAMMQERPRVLVLDEPTAAIDAPTEHALFERFAEAATRTAGITVFVSHRFSTVRMADIIVVVEGGRVTEVGSHPELMQRGGTYAELYELQASAYR
jgi:ATP-binding cassette, subfamily B, bacterial